MRIIPVTGLGQVKQAAIHSKDLQDLQQWLQDPVGENDYSAMDKANRRLREILGSIMTRLNFLSIVVDSGVNAHITKDIIAKAQLLLPDLANLDNLHALLPQVMERAKKFNADPLLVRMIHAVSHAKARPDHLAVVENVAAGRVAPDEYQRTNIHNAKQYLAQSIYQSTGAESRTLLVIRELMQNAVDAAVEQQTRDPKGGPPTVKLTTRMRRAGKDEDGSDAHVLDLMVEDNGVGMNWDTLRLKFFRTHESGKEEYQGSPTGGYGVAKEVIQSMPQHGWALETGDVHTSSYGHNMYFADKDKYVPPAPQIEVSKQGTTITLFGLPYVSDYDIQRLLERYSLGQVDIYFNDNKIELSPDQVKGKPLLNDLQAVADVFSKDEGEKQIIRIMASKVAVSRKFPDLSNLEWKNKDGSVTKMRFEVVKNSNLFGEFVVMLNGQFQFADTEYGLQTLRLLCFLETDAKPGSDGYPIDPGREKLRAGGYKELAKRAIDAVAEIVRMVKESTAFTKGLAVKTFNSNKPPINPANMEQEDPALVARVRSSLSAAKETPMTPEDKKERKERQEEDLKQEEAREEQVKSSLPPEMVQEEAREEQVKSSLPP